MTQARPTTPAPPDLAQHTRVAIVGSRGYQHLDNVRRYVESLPSDCVVVSGGAVGVDTTAAQSARARGLQVQEYLPDYARYGKRAPLVRNGDIVAHADMVVAFWDGRSPGTKYTVDYARRQGLQVLVFSDVAPHWVYSYA